MPNYISDGNGSWFKVAPAIQLQEETGVITMTTAISGIAVDQQA